MSAYFSDPHHKIIAIYYIVFAVLSSIKFAALILITPLGIATFLLLSLIGCQIIFMFSGAIQYWLKNPKGAKTLFWVSLSLVPLIITPLFAYIPKWTLGIMPFFQMTTQFNNMGIEFFFSQMITLNIFPGNRWGFGINIIELLLCLRFYKYMQPQLSTSEKISSPS